MTHGQLPNDFPQHLIEHELDHAEKILWAGRPRQGIFPRMYDAIYVPFAFLMGGLVLTTLAQSIERGGGCPLTFCGGVGLSVSWPVLRGRLAAVQDYYVATDQKVLVVYGLLKTTVRSLKLRDLYAVRLILARRGRGTISFGAPGFLPTNIGFMAPNVLRFDSIENASNVYETIRPHVPQ